MSWLFPKRQRTAIDPQRIEQEHDVASSLELSPFGVPLHPTSVPVDPGRARMPIKRPVSRLLAAEDGHTPRSNAQRGHARLLGGASDANESTLTPEKWIPLYGFQGLVMFNIHDDYSLVDAVVRLAPQQLLNFAFYEETTVVDECPQNNNAPTFTCEIHVDIMSQNYCRNKIRTIFAPEDAEKTHALFVYARDEQPPPPGRWKPGLADETDGHVLLHCVRREYSELQDVAYLRLPANAVHLRYNQYIVWLTVVARILTPGSGLRMLRLDDLGVVAHSFVGIDDSVHSDLRTHGAAGFSHWSWRELVQDSSNGSRLLTLDVMPLDRATLAVMVPGMNLGVRGRRQPRVIVDLHRLGDHPGDFYGSRNRTAVAECINSVVNASTTAAEKETLQYVTVWGSGAFWISEGAPLHKYPLAPHWIDFPTDAGLSSGFVVVRPGYPAYTAHVLGPRDDADGGNSSSRTVTHFEFIMDEKLDAFRQRMQAAGLGHLEQSCLRISQQDPTRPQIFDTARFKKMDHDERARNNRMEFNLEPTASNDMWMFICSQIVGQDIYIEEALVLAVDLTTNIWGYRSTYDNMFSRSQQIEAARNMPAAAAALIASAAAPEPARQKTAVSFFQNAAQWGGNLVSKRRHLEPDPLLGGLNGQDGQIGQDGQHGQNGQNNQNGQDGQNGQNGPNGQDGQNGQNNQTGQSDQNAVDSSRPWKMPLEMFMRSGPDALPFAVGRAVATPNETAALNLMAADLYDLALQRVAPCPYAHEGCQSFFVAGQTLVIQAHIAKAHPPPKQCIFCDLPFTAAASVTEKLQHLVDTHTSIFVASADGNAAPATSLAGGDGINMTPAVDLLQAVGQTAKKKRQVGAGRQIDPPYQPRQDRDGSSTDNDSDEGTDITDDDLIGGSRPRKRKRGIQDPTYRPTRDGDGDEEVEERNNSASSKSKTKRRTAVGRRPNLHDSSYRPGRNGGVLDYSEDVDEELRKSAASEWVRDPFDPTGKRKRVIREKPMVSKEISETANTMAAVEMPRPTIAEKKKAETSRKTGKTGGTGKPLKENRISKPANTTMAAVEKPKTATPKKTEKTETTGKMGNVGGTGKTMKQVRIRKATKATKPLKKADVAVEPERSELLKPSKQSETLASPSTPKEAVPEEVVPRRSGRKRTPRPPRP